MNRTDLENRTKAFALKVIRFVGKLPKNKLTYILGSQLLKSGTSIGANYREANHAMSRADFIHKVNIAEKEASETIYWLELLEAEQWGDARERSLLLKEANELLSIFISIGKTSKSRN